MEHNLPKLRVHLSKLLRVHACAFFICPEEIPSRESLSAFLQSEQPITLVGFSPTGRPQLAWHTQSRALPLPLSLKLLYTNKGKGQTAKWQRPLHQTVREVFPHTAYRQISLFAIYKKLPCLHITHRRTGAVRAFPSAALTNKPSRQNCAGPVNSAGVRGPRAGKL